MSLATAIMLGLSLPAVVGAEEAGAPRPSTGDRCPVCGMFVEQYPHFTAVAEFKDGNRAFFDGPKDLFRYYFNLKKYNPSAKAEDIRNIYVTDYYSLSAIDGFKAFYVTGSDVYGPMGHELIPLASEAEAENFMIDHSGQSLLRFQDVTPDVVKSLN